METKPFEVKSDLELWQKLDMGVERFKAMPPTLTQSYISIYLSQKDRPKGMAFLEQIQG